MNVAEILDRLKALAMSDEKLRLALLETKKLDDPLKSFCDIARENGCVLYPMDIVSFGEESYAAMKRSTNGGGANSPMLDFEDDYYELFLAELG